MTGAGSGKPGAGKAQDTSPSRQNHPHERLDAWKESIALVKAAYAATAGFPPSQQFTLAAQVQRAAVSVSANLAEGVGRGTAGEMARFFTISRGSLMELDTLVILAREPDFLEDGEAGHLRIRIDRINLLLNGLIRRQRGRQS